MIYKDMYNPDDLLAILDQDGTGMLNQDSTEVPDQDGTEMPDQDSTEVPDQDGTEMPDQDGAEDKVSQSLPPVYVILDSKHVIGVVNTLIKMIPNTSPLIPITEGVLFRFSPWVCAVERTDLVKSARMPITAKVLGGEVNIAINPKLLLIGLKAADTKVELGIDVNTFTITLETDNGIKLKISAEDGKDFPDMGFECPDDQLTRFRITQEMRAYFQNCEAMAGKDHTSGRSMTGVCVGVSSKEEQDAPQREFDDSFIDQTFVRVNKFGQKEVAYFVSTNGHMLALNINPWFQPYYCQEGGYVKPNNLILPVNSLTAIPEGDIVAGFAPEELLENGMWQSHPSLYLEIQDVIEMRIRMIDETYVNFQSPLELSKGMFEDYKPTQMLDVKSMTIGFNASDFIKALGFVSNTCHTSKGSHNEVTITLPLGKRNGVGTISGTDKDFATESGAPWNGQIVENTTEATDLEIRFNGRNMPTVINAVMLNASNNYCNFTIMAPNMPIIVFADYDKKAVMHVMGLIMPVMLNVWLGQK